MRQMRVTILTIVILTVLVFLSCDKNTSVDFIPEESEIQIENGITLSINWYHGVPLYYFDYEHYSQNVILQISSNKLIENVKLYSYAIKIEEINVDVVNKDLFIEIDVKKENTMMEKQYIGFKAVKIESFLPDFIQNEAQLKVFKKVKNVFFTVVINYIIGGEQLSSNVTWKFRPIVRKSFSFWDKLMSV
jgi:hypothetical protein